MSPWRPVASIAGRLSPVMSATVEVTPCRPEADKIVAEGTIILDGGPLEQPKPKPKCIAKQQPPGQPLSLPVSVAAVQEWLLHVLTLDISPHAKALAAYISARLNRKIDGKGGYVHPSLETLRTGVRMGRATILAVTPELEAAGVLKVVRPGKWIRGQACEYWPLMPAPRNRKKDDDTDPRVGPQPGPNTVPHAEPYSGDQLGFHMQNPNSPGASPVTSLSQDELGFSDCGNRVLSEGNYGSTCRTTTLETTVVRQPSALRAASPGVMRAKSGSQVENDFLADHRPVIGMIRRALKRPPEQRERFMKKIQAEYSDVFEHALDCLGADGTGDDACDDALADLRAAIEREGNAPSVESSTPAQANQLETPSPVLPPEEPEPGEQPDELQRARDEKAAQIEAAAKKRKKDDEWLANYLAEKRKGSPQ